jgi:uncharacterized protein (TIGR02246 family)
MRVRILLVVLVLSAGLIYAFARAQNRTALPVPTGPAAPMADNGDQEIRKATDDYAAAYNKGDVDGLLALWEPDAEYLDENGKSTRGRAALSALFKKGLEENKGSKMQVKTTTIRFLHDDVAMQDGSVLLVHADGETDSSRFSSVWRKKDGKWLLHLVRDLTSESVVPPDGPQTSLKELGWLVGEWTHEAKDTKTTITGTWMRGQRFLMLDYSVRTKDEEVLSLIQIVGWDPTANQLHSWVFDSRGGFGEGAWSRQGSIWTEEVAGITSDGRHGSCTSKWTRGNENSFTYESSDRDIDGQPLPDVKITYQRTPRTR